MLSTKLISQIIAKIPLIKYSFGQHSKPFKPSNRIFNKNTKQNTKNPSPEIINRVKSNFNYKYNKSRLLDPKFFAQIIDQQFDIRKSLIVLANLSQRNLQKRQFEIIFKKYNYFVYQTFLNINNYYESEAPKQKPLTKLDQKLQEINIKFAFLDSATKIYERNPGFQSQNQTKAFNKTVHELSSRDIFENYLTFQQRIILIECVLRYNIKKAQAIFISKSRGLHKQISDLTEQTALSILNFMGKTKIVDTLFIQMSLDVLYPVIGEMSIQKLYSTLFNLGSTQKFINKGFLIKLAKRFRQLYLSNKVSDVQMMRCIASISLIEKNMQAPAPVDQLDQLYQFSIPQFLKFLPSMKQNQIQTFSAIVRRAKYYDKTVMVSIMEQCLRRQVLQLTQNQEKHKLVSANRKYYNNRNSQNEHFVTLNGLISVLHMSAANNFRHEPFMKYIFTILKLADQLDLIQKKLKGRIVWSLCVLCTKAEVSSLYELIAKQMQYFNNEKQDEVSKQIQKHDIFNFYYCYLYLKTFDPRITINKQVFNRYLSGSQMKTVISEIHQLVYDCFIQAGVACLKQFRISNLLVDIFIPQLTAEHNQEIVKIENVVVDVHGYHHFVRNGTTVDGGNQLKKKLLQSEGYSYYYISIDQWNLIEKEDRQLFIKEYIANVVKNELKKKKSENKKTNNSTRSQLLTKQPLLD